MRKNTRSIFSMENVTKRCSKCRKFKPDDNYGLKKNGTEYRTCMTCRKKQPPTSASASSSPSNVCLPGCVNPTAGLHHCRCPNYVSTRDTNEVFETNTSNTDKFVWKKGFLNTKPKREPAPLTPIRTQKCTYEDIHTTLEYYGIKVYTRDDIYLRYFDPYDFEPIAQRLYHTNSVFMCQISFPPRSCEISFCAEVLRMRIPPEKIKEPLLIIKFYEDELSQKIFTPYVNVLANYVHTAKEKNRKRCTICQEKRKCFRVCHRCKDRYCVECFHNLHDKSMKPCPYCRYSFIEHIRGMFKEMIPNSHFIDTVPVSD